MSLSTPSKPEKIGKFQRKLYRVAKEQPEFRFYSLYDKVYREDILDFAYSVVKANRGGPGVDKETFTDIEKQGLTDWLKSLREELKEKTYEPSPLKRVEIEKDTGGKRPLSIPTIKDRVVQMAVKLVIEPVFEADLNDQAYGYRPNRGCTDAVRKVKNGLSRGYRHVVDADVSGYFDNIPHNQLLSSVSKRIVDGLMLALIKAWPKVPIIKENEKGRTATLGGKSSTKGTPQGGVISPLLANIYMNRYLKAWNQFHKSEEFDAVLVNYADDFVILSRTRNGAEQALSWTKRTMKTMGLSLNEKKTKLCDMDSGEFDFLGYTFGWITHHKTGKRYIGTRPSKKSVRSLKERVKFILRPANKQAWEEAKDQLNYLLTGWANYYSFGTIALTYRAIDHYVYNAVLSFLCKRRKIPSRGIRVLPRKRVFGQLGVRKLCRAPSG